MPLAEEGVLSGTLASLEFHSLQVQGLEQMCVVGKQGLCSGAATRPSHDPGALRGTSNTTASLHRIRARTTSILIPEQKIRNSETSMEREASENPGLDHMCGLMESQKLWTP
jgi:hypothetical protein